MEVIGLDFESYFSTDYSLSKMSTEEYVRDPRFEAIMVCVTNGTEKWSAVGHENIRSLLSRIDWQNTMVVTHNAAFDLFILYFIFGIKVRYAACTLRMMHATHIVGAAGGASLDKLSKYAIANGVKINPKGDEVYNMRGLRLADMSADQITRYKAYCLTDATNTLRCFFWMARELPKVALQSMSATLTCSTQPQFVINKGLARTSLDAVQAEADELLAKAKASLTMVRSDDQLAVALENLGVDPPTKVNTAGKIKWAFAKSDKAFTDLEDHDDPEVQALVAARLGNKSTIAISRAKRMVDMADRGPFPWALRWYGAHTGRLSAETGISPTNAQNFPRNGVLKRALEAPKGMVVFNADSSSIELRIVAGLAGQKDLIKDLREGADTYSSFATEVFGYPVSKATPDARFVGKTVILGGGYGIGPDKAKKQITASARVNNVTLPEDLDWEMVIDKYRRRFPAIPALWRQGGKVLRAMMRGESIEYDRGGLIRVQGNTLVRPNGLKIVYDGLSVERVGEFDEYKYRQFRGKNFIWKKIYGGMMLENCAQALAGDIIAWQWLYLNKLARTELGYDFDVVAGQVHDALISLFLEQHAVEGKQMIGYAMSQVPEWAKGLPIACEVHGPASNYGDCK
jgi:DNA polymerase family A